MRMKATLVGLVIAAVLLGTTAPAGALTQDDSNVHGCVIAIGVQSVFGFDWKRWADATMSSADSPACKALRVEHLTVHTNDNGVLQSARSTVDLLGQILGGDRFGYKAAQVGSFRFAQAEFSWCADGGTSCATRKRTTATIYKGGNILYL